MGKQRAPNDLPLVSLNALMEDQALISGDREEKLNEAFMCCVCLDLLYKPIVLACGHISCFWCVHKAMNGFGNSYCPICRCPYNHFPNICALLHFLLLKMYPIAYKRREKQVLEEETELGYFSPQFGDQLTSSHTRKELDFLVPSSTSSIMCSQTGKINPSTIGEQRNFNGLLHGNTANIHVETYAGEFEATRNIGFEENKISENNLKDGDCEPISISDALCAACKQLLFRPAVLNCGHVYCESCLVTPMNAKPICQLCQSTHPKGSSKVCLELDHFLEDQFSQEYALRKQAVQLKSIHSQQESPSACATEATKNGTLSSSSPSQNYFSWLGERGLLPHMGVGCDNCGMLPIIGERYKCKDCVEKIGFDLCGECYNSRSKLPGRFNQQHKPEHRFELVQSNMLRNVLFDDDTHAAYSVSDDLEDPPGPNSAI